MELEQLKNLWVQQDKKLEKSLQLNMQLLREMNFDKAGKKLRTLIWLKAAEMSILLFMMICLLSFTIRHIAEPGFSISSFIIFAFITSGFISDIRQMGLIVEIRAGYTEPIGHLQKKVERLKLLIVNYVKMSFLSIPFFPLLMIVSAKIFFNVDFLAPQFRAYLIANIVVGALLLPVFLWLFRLLSKPNISNTWVKNFLSGSGWNQASLAQQFLTKIEEFERGE
jgi:cellulose synthase/poly-beta-1,6-N-acetylglucosamine synthase-like glycosyltransferase